MAILLYLYSDFDQSAAVRRQRHWRVATDAAPATPPIASCRDSSDRI
ncbi:hypothetical protein [Leptolyngbya sp. FACHB-16]|nr:hypothetical protein [Leptolyngbya sp. FACHB-16]MBD2156004.1 hypothetical protein [Leptolyngbya sp. FACHB-16]